MFLKHAIKEYEFDCKARKLGVNTIQGYMRMLRYLMDYLEKEYDITQIEDVKPFHIKHFLLLKQEEGSSTWGGTRTYTYVWIVVDFPGKGEQWFSIPDQLGSVVEVVSE